MLRERDRLLAQIADGLNGSRFPSCIHSGAIFAGTLTIHVDGEAFFIRWTPSPQMKEQVSFKGVGLRDGERRAVAAFWLIVE